MYDQLHEIDATVFSTDAFQTRPKLKKFLLDRICAWIRSLRLLRVYEFRFPGLALGGCCIVIARSEVKATKLFLAKIDGIPPKFQCKMVGVFEGEMITYFWDGDY